VSFDNLKVHELGYKTILIISFLYITVTLLLPPFLPYNQVSSIFLPFIAVQLAATLHLFSLSNAVYSVSVSIESVDLFTIGNRISDCGTDAGFGTALLTGCLLVWTAAVHFLIEWKTLIPQKFLFAVLFGGIVFSIHWFVRAIIRHEVYHDWFHGVEEELKSRRFSEEHTSTWHSLAAQEPSFSDHLNEEPRTLADGGLNIASSVFAVVYYIIIRSCVIPFFS